MGLIISIANQKQQIQYLSDIKELLEQQNKLLEKQNDNLYNIETQLINSNQNYDDMIDLLQYIKENTRYLKFEKGNDNRNRSNSNGYNNSQRNKRDNELKPRKVNSNESYSRKDELIDKYGTNDMIENSQPLPEYPMSFERTIYVPDGMNVNDLPNYIQKQEDEMKQLEEKK